VPTLPRHRLPYSAVVDRPKLALPGDSRMIVWTIVNVEEWDIERPLPRTVLPPPMHQPLLPDLPNWAWHEYGMRVGFWRLRDCLRALRIVPTLAINGSVCQSYPAVAKAGLEAGWEFMGHGYTQRPMHHLDDERTAIRQTIQAIRDFTGKRPRGWESPGLTETYNTIDLLAEEGIEYVADWVLDDQPCEITTTRGSIVSIPYTLEINDVATIAVQNHSPVEFQRRAVDQFDCLYRESETITRVMAISLHPYLSGVAHRIKYVEAIYEHIGRHPGVLFWTGEQILDWYRATASR